jgi:hypothetical protein
MSESGREVERLGLALAKWRKSPTRKRRIPESLWDRAVELARVQGISQVSRQLSLSFYHLKRRVEGAEPNEAPAFVEWLVPPATSKIGECVIKVETVSGARMQTELTNIEPIALATIIREFAAS